MAYLIHYNKNHSTVNGQFIPGDGDGDGMVNDNDYRKMSDQELRRRIRRKRDEQSYEQLYPSRGQKVVNAGNDMQRTAQTLQNVHLPKKKGPKADLSQYSDQELQRIINRARNEQEYDRLFNPERESNGQKFVNGLTTTLAIVGGVVTIVGGGLKLYDQIKDRIPKKNSTPLGLPG